MEMVLGSVRKRTWVKIIVCLVAAFSFACGLMGAIKWYGFFVCTCRWSRKQNNCFLPKQKPKLQKNVEFRASQGEEMNSQQTHTHTHIKDNDVNRMIEYRLSQSKFMKRIVLTNCSIFNESKNCVHKFALPTEFEASQDQNGFIPYQFFEKCFCGCEISLKIG